MRKRYGKGYEGNHRMFGTDDRIKILETCLRKNIAVRDQVPIVEFTNRGNIGVYGALGSHVIAMSADKVEKVTDVLNRFLNSREE